MVTSLVIIARQPVCIDSRKPSTSAIPFSPTTSKLFPIFWRAFLSQLPCFQANPNSCALLAQTAFRNSFAFSNFHTLQNYGSLPTPAPSTTSKLFAQNTGVYPFERVRLAATFPPASQAPSSAARFSAGPPRGTRFLNSSRCSVSFSGSFLHFSAVRKIPSLFFSTGCAISAEKHPGWPTAASFSRIAEHRSRKPRLAPWNNFSPPTSSPIRTLRCFHTRRLTPAVRRGGPVGNSDVLR